jgi:hypothetical protein
LAYALDNQFGIGNFRFGLSVLLDAIPGVGDFIDVVLSLYIVWIAMQMRVPSKIIGTMIGNIATNFVLGLVPVVGELTYMFRKVNIKNVNLLKQYAPHIEDAEIIK